MVQAAPAAEWTDATTRHRIVRISREAGSLSLYFHQNSYTPQGDKMVIATPGGIAVVTLADWSVTPLVRNKHAKLLFAGRKTRTAYYSVTRNTGSVIHSVDIDSGKVRKIVSIDRGTIGSINADETLLLGQWAQAAPPLQPGGEGNRPGETAFAATGTGGTPLSYADAKEVRLNQRLEAKIPMEIFTIDIRTGARRVVVASTDWLNHVQFSPTDPMRILYCHEGPWHKVDRIWTVRADGSDKRLVHKRMMNMEIAGHEFFSADGKWIWYDLQTRAAKYSGSRAMSWRRASAAGCRSIATTGRSITAHRRTAGAFQATAATVRWWPVRRMANISTASRPVRFRT